MKVFFKYVIKSMTEKKGRFLLLMIAIAISTALLVASNGMISIILNSLVSPTLEAYEQKEIIINSTDESSYFFSDEGLQIKGIQEEGLLKELYVAGSIVDQAGTEDENMLSVTVRGRMVKDINKEIITQGNLEGFDGTSCIISERTAQERNLKLGDTIDVVIAGKTETLKIRAISGAAGVFYSDTDKAFAVMVPYEYLSKDLGAEGKYNQILANSSEQTIKAGIEKFNKDNKVFTAKEVYDKDTAEQQFASFKNILYVMMIVVVVMSAIIIYSSFKLIITERLSTIGTFLSQGATVGKVKSVLYLESFMYGLIGAVFGNGLGIAALYVINRYVSPLKEYGIYGKVLIEPSYLIIGTSFAIILSVVSALLPVRKISKLQVKDVILNDVRISKSIGWKKFIAGIILLGASIIAYVIAKNNIDVASRIVMVASLAAVALIGSLTGVILLYPKLIDLLSRVLFQVLRGRSKNVIYAINNLRTSKILLGNISLIIISLFSIIMITSLGSSLINVVTEAYTKLEFDATINNISDIRENQEESTADYLVGNLKDIGIKENEINLMNDQYGTLEKVKEEGEVPFILTGINPDTYIEFNQYLKLDQPEYRDYIKNLKKDEAGAIITTTLNRFLEKEVGDTMKVTCNGLEKTLKISGIVDGKLFNSGFFMFITNETMKEQYGMASANSISFTTNKNLDKVMKDLKPVLREVGATSITKDKMCEDNLKGNQMIVDALSIFSYLAIIIAALGIVNNVSISFLQRKTEFAVLASVGMEDAGRTRILFVESIVSVTWAMLITSVYCILGLKIISVLVRSVGFSMDILLNISSLPMVYLISLAIVLIATIPVFVKSRKLSIIQELKYE